MSIPTDDAASEAGWLRVRRHRGVIVISASGSLDAHHAARLCDLLDPFASLRDGLVVDLGALHYCGVAGLRMLLTLGANYHRTGTPWVLVPGPVPVRLLVMTHRRDVLTVADTVEAAIGLLRERLSLPRLHVVP